MGRELEVRSLNRGDDPGEKDERILTESGWSVVDVGGGWLFLQEITEQDEDCARLALALSGGVRLDWWDGIRFVDITEFEWGGHVGGLVEVLRKADYPEGEMGLVVVVNNEVEHKIRVRAGDDEQVLFLTWGGDEGEGLRCPEEVGMGEWYGSLVAMGFDPTEPRQSLEGLIESGWMGNDGGRVSWRYTGSGSERVMGLWIDERRCLVAVGSEGEYCLNTPVWWDLGVLVEGQDLKGGWDVYLVNVNGIVGDLATNGDVCWRYLFEDDCGGVYR